MNQTTLAIAATMLTLLSNTAVSAQEIPQKDGYRMVWNDEFNGTKLNKDKWIAEYLPSWVTDRESAAANYKIENGVVKLIIDKDERTLRKENYYMTGFMSGSRSGLHRSSPSNKVKSRVPTEATNLNQYGYYEMRAKMQRGGGVHTAWWLVGFEDDTTKSCEVDIFEILGSDKDRVWSTFHPWRDKTLKYKTMNPHFNNRKLDEEFHIYGFEWTPDSIFVYVDGLRTFEHAAKINYPLMQIISFYDNRNPQGGWTGSYDPTVPYPKTFEIDYVRLYKKIPQGYNAVKSTDLCITKVDPALLTVNIDSTKSATSYSLMRNIDGHITPEIYGTPTYVNVRYNDGTVTQQFVEWQEVDDNVQKRIKAGQTVVVDGTIKGLPAALLSDHKAVLVIKGVIQK